MATVHRLGVIVGSFLLVLGLAGPSFASDPPSHDVQAPSSPGAEETVEWTGSIPPGANSGSTCADSATVDEHTIELAVPPGTYENVRIRMNAAITYDGPANDVIITLVMPDGETVSGDGGFVDTDESVTLANPAAGTYKVLACMFAGALPQDYTGSLTLIAEENTPTFASGPTCTPPSQGMKFEQKYVDETRAGGEPMIIDHPNGNLLWGSHAGTTHFFGPAAPDPQTAAFLENYQGQTYQYVSEDGGTTWSFVPRIPIEGATAGLPNSGFSDPEFAVDAAGNIFISEINLANVAVSKSSDGGRSYTLQNVTGLTFTDRQWMAADQEDVLYMTGNAIAGGTFPGVPAGTSGHILTKSTDGGVTFTQPEVANDAGVGDILVKKETGDLYEISEAGGTLSMAIYRGIRDADSNFGDLVEKHEIVTGAGLSGIGRQIDPTFDMDDDGNLYFVWSENGLGVRPAGIYYSYSTDDGSTWALPVRIDPDENTEIWPWLEVGDQGEVAIVYLATDNTYEENNAELAEDDDAWNVHVAYTEHGLGCEGSGSPGFQIVQASQEPVHHGTICMGGTACQAELVDRRLGDYFSNTIDSQGNVHIAVSDTRQGGSVALPLHIQQVGGTSLRGGAEPPTTTSPPQPAPQPSEEDGGGLPATGGGLALAGVGLLALSGIGTWARRRRT